MNEIIQMKITLMGSKPPIWRRVLVEKKITFLKLHQTIQMVMGWENSHLYEFELGGLRISGDDPFADIFGFNDDLETDGLSANKVLLKKYLTQEKQVLAYTYDFGDDWTHKILIEKFLPKDPKLSYPTCIKGKMNCPPEDCGGIWGFYDLLETIKDKKNPEREEMLEWLGEDYDPNYFDLNEINDELKRYL